MSGRTRTTRPASRFGRLSATNAAAIVAWRAALVGLSLGFCWNVERRVDAAPPAPAAVLDGFLTAVDARADWTPEQKARVRAVVDAARSAPDRTATALVDALREVVPSVREATDGLAAADKRPAYERLARLTTDADPYVASVALDLLGRSLAEAGRPADALPHLTAAVDKHLDRLAAPDKTLLARARAEAALLRRKAAAATYGRLLNDGPPLTDERRAVVEQELAELAKLVPGSLDDVRDRMQNSRRRLEAAETGAELQAEQAQIVELLDRLIEQAGRQEAQAKGESQASGRRPGPSAGDRAGDPTPGETPPPSDGEMAAQAGEPDPSARSTRRSTRAGPQSPWGRLRDKQRDPVYNAVQEKLPVRYRQLIEQYYRSFQEDRP